MAVVREQDPGPQPGAELLSEPRTLAAVPLVRGIHYPAAGKLSELPGSDIDDVKSVTSHIIPIPMNWIDICQVTALSYVSTYHGVSK
jgi:hypothetical protein